MIGSDFAVTIVVDGASGITRDDNLQVIVDLNS